MKKERLSVVGMLATLFMLLLVVVWSGFAQQKTGGTEALAQKLVNQCLSVQEGEIVLITGGVRDFQLLEDLAVQVRRVGAFPLLALWSDRLTREMYTEVPEKYDTQTYDLDQKLMNMVTAVIGVEYRETEGALVGIPARRIAARAKAYQPVSDLILKRRIRGLYLGNNLYPTAELAKRFEMSREELSEVFWEAVDIDYEKLRAVADVVKSILTTGKEVHLTNPNGTDLKARIEGRPVVASVGVLSPEDLKEGYAARQVYLPAGEVFFGPVPGTAEGTVVVNKAYYQGKEIVGLKLSFKAGKLVSMTAQSGLEPLKARYDAADPGKELFAFIDLGINPTISSGPESKILSWIPSGMISVGIGNDVGVGGSNNCSFGFSAFIPGCTFQVDKETIVENGVAKF